VYGSVYISGAGKICQFFVLFFIIEGRGAAAVWGNVQLWWVQQLG